MEDLLATFGPKFVAIATTRIARSLDLASQPNPDVTTIARELHSIAGEAGLLGLAKIVSLARASEEQAKRLRTAPSDSQALALRASLTELRGAIELVSAGRDPSP